MRPFLAFLVLSFGALSGLAAGQVPSPKEFLGHDVGEDRWLCDYENLTRYFAELERTSDRVALEDIGPTSYGQRMVMAIVTSPKNHRRLAEYREIARRLCLARGVDEDAARALAARGKAVVWIDAGLHASECVAGQNLIELVWQMASRDDEEVRRILDGVILLACPANPDGLELVAKAYAATGSTSTPVLYQRYVGHDNNRDFYVCNQLESENINRVFYRRWFPQIVYNHHQTAPPGTIIFTPPFRDPFNYHVDPMTVRGIEVVSAHMNARFALEGKAGVISRTGAPYSTWWNGGLRSTVYFHNMIGILTESFGRPEPTAISVSAERRLPTGDHPFAVDEQVWHPRQTIDYLMTANLAILDYAARYREELLFGIWRMGDRAIRLGSSDHWTVTPRMLEASRLREDPRSVFSDPCLRDPRAYVLRGDQPDFPSAVRFVRALQKNGIEVLRARAPFLACGVECPATSFVVRTAQAFRAHVLDMFEPQWHPNDMRDGKPVPPYDAAGWTLAMQMDVEVLRSFEDVRGEFEPMDGLAAFPPRLVADGAAGWRFDPRNSNSAIAANRLLREGFAVERRPDGTYFARRREGLAPRISKLAMELGVPFGAVENDTGEPAFPLRRSRVGLLDVYGGSMPAGHDRWILEQYEFDVRPLWGGRVVEGDLGRDFDVIVAHAGLPSKGRSGFRAPDPKALEKLKAALPPFEDWSDLEQRSVRLTADNASGPLRRFVERGGTLLCLGGECEKAIEMFDLPIDAGVFVPDADAPGGRRRAGRDEFYIPGSLVAIEPAIGHPLARGLSESVATMFSRSSKALLPREGAEGVSVVARYRKADTLVSGWAIGDEWIAGQPAVVEARVGEGRIVLYGPDVTYRGQPTGSFDLLFSAIFDARPE
ncbi:MAG: M14 family metallopeptidase [Planctomycetota bacterium]